MSNSTTHTKTSCADVEHLTGDPHLQQMFALAFDARTFSYSPYSKFRVGAAILTESGEIITETHHARCPGSKGCNVENASYGLTICAERNAMCCAVAKGYKHFKAIAVTSDVKESFTYPCGACLQFMLEFGRDIPVYFLRADLKAVDKRLVRELAPFGFGPEDLDLNSQKTNFAQGS